jgi:hypothetical protein
MFRKMSKGLFGVLIMLLSQQMLLSGAQPFEHQTNIDLAVYKIKEKEVQNMLRADAISIRTNNYMLSTQEMPLLRLHEIDEKQIYSRLENLVRRFSQERLSREEVQDLSDILTTTKESKVYWINRASGSYAFCENKEIMSIPTTISDHREAADIALKYVVEKNLVDLGPHESLDVEFVSTVMNAAVKNNDMEPMMQYASDYFVGFGRRYLGVPVVGSRLVLRIGDSGRLFGVQKTWRPIIAEGDLVSIDYSLLTDWLHAHEKNIEILATSCGYIEGPVKNQQKMMGPGCIVNYREIYDPAGMISQEVIPLADVGFPLVGKMLEPTKVQPLDEMPIEDPDDNDKEDEIK